MFGRIPCIRACTCTSCQTRRVFGYCGLLGLRCGRRFFFLRLCFFTLLSVLKLIFMPYTCIPKSTAREPFGRTDPSFGSFSELKDDIGWVVCAMTLRGPCGGSQGRGPHTLGAGQVSGGLVESVDYGVRPPLVGLFMGFHSDRLSKFPFHVLPHQDCSPQFGAAAAATAWSKLKTHFLGRESFWELLLPAKQWWMLPSLCVHLIVLRLRRIVVLPQGSYSACACTG